MKINKQLILEYMDATHKQHPGMRLNMKNMSTSTTPYKKMGTRGANSQGEGLGKVAPLAGIGMLGAAALSADLTDDK